jgi:hypothetical protein
MPTPFDPLSWLTSKGVTAKLMPDGSVQLLFDSSTRRPERERIKRVIFNGYLSLLRMQLDVPDGTKPRSVFQLLASGRLKIVEGKYVTVRGGQERS